METYSISVALFDFLPVIATSFALSYLASGISARNPELSKLAWLGAVLVPLGGLCKASWKLIVASQQMHIVWLENALFIFMAPGFVALAFCLRHSLPTDTATNLLPRICLWLALCVGGAVIAASALPESRLWFFWLLAWTSLANFSLLFWAWKMSTQLQLARSVKVGISLSFLATLAMTGLSRLPDSEMTAWIQETVNLFGQSCLLYACCHLKQGMTRPNTH